MDLKILYKVVPIGQFYHLSQKLSSLNTVPYSDNTKKTVFILYRKQKVKSLFTSKMPTLSVTPESYTDKELWLSEVSYVHSDKDIENEVSRTLKKCQGWDEPFYVANLGHLVENYRLWKKELPGVDMFYAVKANDDPMVLKLLATLGSSFDCASKGEIERVIGLGVSPDRIAYSNPYKLESHLSYANSVGVRWMVCDSLDELRKIHDLSENAKVMVRILPRNDKSLYLKFSEKFGCNAEEAKKIFLEAKRLNVNIEGISFYVGHCTESPDPYADAIAMAKELYLEACRTGHYISLVDLGGGFQGQEEKRELFFKVAASIKNAIAVYFPKELGVRIIGEPGQYMVVQAMEVYAKVVGVRQRQSENGENSNSVFVSGGHFSCLPNYNFKYFKSQIQILEGHKNMEREKKTKTTFWGPTCDPMDCLVTLDFPNVERGQWLKFTNFGAYSRSIMSQYNGFPLAPTKYYMTYNTREELEHEKVEK